MAAIEWHSGLPYWGQNLNTSDNIAIGSSTIHALFDSGKIALLPTKSGVLPILKQLALNEEDLSPDAQAHLSRKIFKTKVLPIMESEKIYDYTLFPLDLEGTKKIPIMWVDDTSTYGNVHWYPYEKFPTIRSHVRPHYVLYDLGAKLTKMVAESPDTGNVTISKLSNELQEHFSGPGNTEHANVCFDLGFVRRLFELWSRLPTDWRDDESFGYRRTHPYMFKEGVESSNLSPSTLKTDPTYTNPAALRAMRRGQASSNPGSQYTRASRGLSQTARKTIYYEEEEAEMEEKQKVNKRPRKSKGRSDRAHAKDDSESDDDRSPPSPSPLPGTVSARGSASGSKSGRKTTSARGSSGKNKRKL